MKTTLIVGTMVAASAFAQTPTPPLEVRGIPLGATVEQLRQRIPQFRCYGATCTFDPGDAAAARCGPVSADPAVLACYAEAGSENAFGPAHGAQYTAYLRDGRVGEFRITFPSALCDDVVSALRDKYGAPSDDREFQTKNQLGATFGNRAVTWRRADGKITVERRATDVDTGLATFIAAWYATATADDKAIAEQSDAVGQ